MIINIDRIVAAETFAKYLQNRRFDLPGFLVVKNQYLASLDHVRHVDFGAHSGQRNFSSRDQRERGSELDRAGK